VRRSSAAHKRLTQLDASRTGLDLLGGVLAASAGRQLQRCQDRNRAGAERMASEPMRAQIGTLIIATSCVQLANGFFGTFISLRVVLEGFDATMAGLVLSSFFLRVSPWRGARRTDY
jgi:hypothetical protein